jgi:hypothetical protein
VVVRILFASSLWWCGSCSPRHRGGADLVRLVIVVVRILFASSSWWCELCSRRRVVVV